MSLGPTSMANTGRCEVCRACRSSCRRQCVPCKLFVAPGCWLTSSQQRLNIDARSEYVQCLNLHVGPTPVCKKCAVVIAQVNRLAKTKESLVWTVLMHHVQGLAGDASSQKDGKDSERAVVGDQTVTHPPETSADLRYFDVGNQQCQGPLRLERRCPQAAMMCRIL